MNEQVAQIRAVIERNRKVAHKAAKDSPDIEQKKYHEGKEFAYRVAEILIDSLPDEPDADDLEEEVRKDIHARLFTEHALEQSLKR